ncbi:MAG TPA: phospholipase D family protein [Arenimonas sp.]|nr:phospholipase D family protein [Arenimonas sp.]
MYDDIRVVQSGPEAAEAVPEKPWVAPATETTWMKSPFMRIGLIFKVFIVLAVAGTPLVGHAALPERPDLPLVGALPTGDDSPLDKALIPKLEANSGMSGFRLIPNGMEAFALRAMTARAASRSLDIQYYIWHNDTTGRLLVHELKLAADRGVRVRLLLDDMDARGNNFALAALDAHPRIDVRVFNPYVSRSGTFGKVWETMTSFKRINHRMHNKSWIADNRVALAGGRNIGDEYFSASDEVNFIDLDYALLGPAVETLSASFDAYWNSIATYPVSVLSPELVNAGSLAKLIAESESVLRDDLKSPYISALKASEPMRTITEQTLYFQWTADWKVLSDDPLKALKTGDGLDKSHVLQGFRAALQGAEKDITLISPYFVPGKEGTANLIGADKQGRAVSVLTNSLLANDVAAVHGGYSKYRKDLVKGGVEVYELKPSAGKNAGSSWFGSSGASLHTKAALIDDTSAFVGSFNLDPRSVSLNCEQGILASHPQLAKDLRAIYSKVTTGKSAWQVGIDQRNKLTWTDDSGMTGREPKASLGRRFQAFLFRIFPLDSQL